MLKWLSRRKAEDAVGSDIANARSLLPAIRLRLDKGGAPATRAYGEGVADVAGFLARSYGVSVTDAVTGRGLGVPQLDVAYRDLVASQERCRSYFESEDPAARALAERLAMGCLILSHLYRLRFHARQAPEDRRVEADALADSYANLARFLADAGREAGPRDDGA